MSSLTPEKFRGQQNQYNDMIKELETINQWASMVHNSNGFDLVEPYYRYKDGRIDDAETYIQEHGINPKAQGLKSVRNDLKKWINVVINERARQLGLAQ